MTVNNLSAFSSVSSIHVSNQGCITYRERLIQRLFNAWWKYQRIFQHLHFDTRFCFPSLTSSLLFTMEIWGNMSSCLCCGGFSLYAYKIFILSLPSLPHLKDSVQTIFFQWNPISSACLWLMSSWRGWFLSSLPTLCEKRMEKALLLSRLKCTIAVKRKLDKIQWGEGRQARCLDVLEINAHIIGWKNFHSLNEISVRWKIVLWTA